MNVKLVAINLNKKGQVTSSFERLFVNTDKALGYYVINLSENFKNYKILDLNTNKVVKTNYVG